MDHALIISGCKQGDPRAQRALFEYYSKGLLALCRRYVQNNSDAEDMLLNGFQKFFSTIGRFEYNNESSTGAWLKKIMVNECLMFLRRDNKIRFVAEEYKGDVALNEEVLAGMGAKAILSLIATIPAGYRIVFNLFVIEGFTHKEIAGILGTSEGTSKSQLMRARNHLQKLLEKNGVVYENG